MTNVVNAFTSEEKSTTVGSAVATILDWALQQAPVQEVIARHLRGYSKELAGLIEQVMETEIENAVESAVNEVDVDGKIESALEDVDIERQVERAVESAIDDIDVDGKIQEVVDSVVDDHSDDIETKVTAIVNRFMDDKVLGDIVVQVLTRLSEKLGAGDVKANG
jgi:uncharacterized membrane-anchored protein YjiN (DUF445 family)